MRRLGWASFPSVDAAAALDSRVLSLPDAGSTLALGARLADLLRAGDVVCLKGGLGAGKTTLARGVVSVWAGAEDAPSPTYTLLQIYDGPKGSLWHVDLYRLKHPDEAQELGLEDGFVEAACLIEWPERLGAGLPRDRLEIALSPEGEGRRAELTGFGAWRARLDEI